LGEWIFPSFFKTLMAFETSLLSMPRALATSPGRTGFPASFMAFSTASAFSLIFTTHTSIWVCAVREIGRASIKNSERKKGEIKPAS
jgi:hypothetical protein